MSREVTVDERSYRKYRSCNDLQSNKISPVIQQKLKILPSWPTRSVYLRNSFLSNLWGFPPEIVKISRLMLFLSSSRVWEFVLHSYLFKLPHKQKSQCVKSGKRGAKYVDIEKPPQYFETCACCASGTLAVGCQTSTTNDRVCPFLLMWILRTTGTGVQKIQDLFRKYLFVKKKTGVCRVLLHLLKVIITAIPSVTPVTNC